MKKFEELDAILMTAKYCLGEGSRFDRKAYSECNGVRTYDKKAQYHLNLHDLKSAVVWYNSSIDYLSILDSNSIPLSTPMLNIEKNFGNAFGMKNTHSIKIFAL